MVNQIGSVPSAPGVQATPRFPELLGIRGILALGVVFVHADVRPGFWLISMMDCFFALSAFLITLGLLEWQGPTVGSRMKHFYVRRVARIFPGYYALLLAIAMLLIAIDLASSHVTLHRYSLTELIPYVFYVQFTDLYGSTNELTIWNSSLRFLYHTWSLALEEQFYVIWGVLFFVAKKPWMKVAVALLFCAIGIGSRASGLVVSPLLPYRLDAFGYGIGIALFFHYVISRPGVRPEQVRSWAQLSLVAFVLAMSIFLQGSGIPEVYYRWIVQDVPIDYFQWTPMSIMSCFGAAALIGALLLSTGSRASSFFRSRVPSYLGRISYALYLVHYPILDVLLYINTRVLPFGHWGNAAIGVVLAVLSAHMLTGLMNAAQRAIILWIEGPPGLMKPRAVAEPSA